MLVSVLAKKEVGFDILRHHDLIVGNEKVSFIDCWAHYFKKILPHIIDIPIAPKNR